MISPREKFLFVGPSGGGKSKAMMDIAVRALAAGRNVFFLAFDDGYMRHLAKVEKYLIHHTDPELTSGVEVTNHFHIWDCTDWPMTRRAYGEAKVLWEKRDWMMFDRADISWDFIQEYTSAVQERVAIEDIDELYYQRRLEKMAAAGPMERAQIKANPSGEIEIDWTTVKGSFKGVLYDALCGTDGRLMRINVVVSELAQPGIRRFSKTESTEQKADARRLYSYNMTIQGEKNVPSWTETTVVFMKNEVGYVIGTDKDRERKQFSNEILDEKLGFWDAYQSLVGEDLEV